MAETRRQLIETILAKQDDHHRWGFDEQMARKRPELTYYWPKYSSSLWTLLLLADLQAPPDCLPMQRAFDCLTKQFYDPASGVFSLGTSHFPIPCLNGNMLYLHFYLGRPPTSQMDGAIDFLHTYQRFDDGGFKTPKDFPYFSNKSCYGKHTCFWGVAKLMKGLSFIPWAQRTPHAQELLDRCIEFVLQHEVCFQSHQKESFLHLWIGQLTFPTAWRTDFLELLWVLAREGIHDSRMERALDLLRSRRTVDGSWRLEHPMAGLIVPLKPKALADALITERALEVVR